MMLGLIDLGAELIGVVNPDDLVARTTVEQVRVDKVMRRTVAAGDTDTIDPAKAHEAYARTTASPLADRRLPVDRRHFPPGRRLELTKRRPSSPASDGTNHLISFGEFAALYLMVWSNACWSDEIPGATFVRRRRGRRRPSTTRAAAEWTSADHKSSRSSSRR